MALALLLEDDLGQDRAGDVLAGLGVIDDEVGALLHHFGEIVEGDIGAGRGVVEAPVGVFLDDDRVCAVAACSPLNSVSLASSMLPSAILSALKRLRRAVHNCKCKKHSERLQSLNARIATPRACDGLMSAATSQHNRRRSFHGQF